MMHPAVMAAYVEAFAHITVVQTFAVISIDKTADPTFRSAHDRHFQDYGAISNPAQYAEYHKMDLQLYGLSVSAGTLQFVGNNDTFVSKMYSERGSCGSNRSSGNSSSCCLPRGKAQRLATGRDNYWNEAEQVWKVHLCYNMVQAWETRHPEVGRFQWLIRWRPDIIPLSRFVTFSSLQTTKAYVNFDTQDHYFICYRRETCDKYLGIVDDFLGCRAGLQFNGGLGRRGIHFIGYAGFLEKRNNLGFLTSRYKGHPFPYRLFRDRTFIEECHRRQLGRGHSAADQPYERRLAASRFFPTCEVDAAVREYEKLSKWKSSATNRSQGKNELLQSMLRLCDGGGITGATTGSAPCGDILNISDPTINEGPAGLGLSAPHQPKYVEAPTPLQSDPLVKLVREIRSIVGCGSRVCKRPLKANFKLDQFALRKARDQLGCAPDAPSAPL